MLSCRDQEAKFEDFIVMLLAQHLRTKIKGFVSVVALPACCLPALGSSLVKNIMQYFGVTLRNFSFKNYSYHYNAVAVLLCLSMKASHRQFFFPINFTLVKFFFRMKFKDWNFLHICKFIYYETTYNIIDH